MFAFGVFMTSSHSCKGQWPGSANGSAKPPLCPRQVQGTGAQHSAIRGQSFSCGGKMGRGMFHPNQTGWRHTEGFENTVQSCSVQQKTQKRNTFSFLDCLTGKWQWQLWGRQPTLSHGCVWKHSGFWYGARQIYPILRHILLEIWVSN